jgi:hypothetical protein
MSSTVEWLLLLVGFLVLSVLTSLFVGKAISSSNPHNYPDNDPLCLQCKIVPRISNHTEDNLFCGKECEDNWKDNQRYLTQK